MTKRILDIGSCGPDHASLSRLVGSHFDAELQQAHGLDDALEALRGGHFDLVTVNRLMDRDGSEGLEIIKTLRADARLNDVPLMMITNYPEHQQLAVEAGAVKGFGKNSLFSPETLEVLRPFLS